MTVKYLDIFYHFCRALTAQVTNFVRQADPGGERTLLVLTKVDRAVADPVRLKQILDGKLFPLRALGYFAVVSGTDDRDASISTIRKYENDFFQKSNLLRSGILKVEQLGTQNMCDAVSKIFWSLVKSSMTSELAKARVRENATQNFVWNDAVFLNRVRTSVQNLTP